MKVLEFNKHSIPMRIVTDTEYDHLMDVALDDKRSHWKNEYSWVNDTDGKYTKCPASDRVTRGNLTARAYHYCAVYAHYSVVGFRPAFDLDMDALPAGIQVGDMTIIGTLYMNKKPVRVPQESTEDGDIANYVPGSKLEMRPALLDSSYQVTGIFLGDGVFVADRNLIKRVSYEDLAGQGLEITPSTPMRHPVEKKMLFTPAPESIRILDIGNVCKALFADLCVAHTATQAGDGIVTDYYSICTTNKEPNRDISVSLIQRKTVEDGDKPYLELHVVDDIHNMDCYMKDISGLGPDDVLGLSQKAQDAVTTALWEIIASSGVKERPSSETQALEMKEAQKTETRTGMTGMSCFRLKFLLNAVIHQMIKDEGAHTYRVAEKLLELGFTGEELVKEFQFPASDINIL